MSAVTYTELRANLATYMDRVCDSRTPLLVTRQNARSVIMLAEEEYESLLETFHLLRSPANAARLLASVREADAGILEEHEPATSPSSDRGVKLLWTRDAWDEYCRWVDEDRKVAGIINDLIRDLRRDPFRGLGKPEPLKHELRGWWSRRITGEHRLVCRVIGMGDDRRVEISACRHHY